MTFRNSDQAQIKVYQRFCCSNSDYSCVVVLLSSTAASSLYLCHPNLAAITSTRQSDRDQARQGCCQTELKCRFLRLPDLWSWPSQQCCCCIILGIWIKSECLPLSPHPTLAWQSFLILPTLALDALFMKNFPFLNPIESLHHKQHKLACFTHIFRDLGFLVNPCPFYCRLDITIYFRDIQISCPKEQRGSECMSLLVVISPAFNISFQLKSSRLDHLDHHVDEQTPDTCGCSVNAPCLD